MIHILAFILISQTSVIEVGLPDCYRDLVDEEIQQQLVTTIEKVIEKIDDKDEKDKKAAFLSVMDSFLVDFQSNEQKTKLIIQFMFNRLKHREYYAKYLQDGRGVELASIINVLAQKINPPPYETSLAIYDMMDCKNSKFANHCRGLLYNIGKPEYGTLDLNPLFAVLDLKYKENPEVDFSPNFIKTCWWLHPAKTILYVLYKFPQYNDLITDFSLPEKCVESDAIISGRTLTPKPEFTSEIQEKLTKLLVSEKFIDNFVASGLYLIFFADKCEEMEKDLNASRLDLYMYMKGTMSLE